MNDNKEIFISDTTITYKNLKKNLNDVYGLDLITQKQKYIYLGVIFVLSSLLIYNIIKK